MTFAQYQAQVDELAEVVEQASTPWLAKFTGIWLNYPDDESRAVLESAAIHLLMQEAAPPRSPGFLFERARCKSAAWRYRE